MKLLLYCTKAKPQLIKVSREYCLIKSKDNQNIFEALNGKIVAECDFEVELQSTDYRCIDFIENDENGKSDLIRSCLTREQLCKYVKGSVFFYAIHINNLHIFDEPKELQDYATIKKVVDDFYLGYYERFESVGTAPQNMQYVYEVNSDNPNEKKVLISIRPEWLCKILNGEKTIEVRRKVLKEMLKYEV